MGSARKEMRRRREWDVRFKSSVIEVTVVSVRLELTAAQETVDMKSFLLSRVITSSFLAIPCGVTVHESSIVRPSFSQWSRGLGTPVDKKNSAIRLTHKQAVI